MTIGNTKRGMGAASALLAGALVGIALLVLVGAGVYSKAQGRNAIASDVEVGSVEMAPASDTEVTFSLANVLGWNTQKSKRVMPPPPPPAQPAQAPEPPNTSQPAQPRQPPNASQPAMPPPPPPEPAQSDLPAQPPQPPEASSVPKPARAPGTSETPQMPPPPPPEPAQAPKPSHPLPASMGGSGVATGIGRGVGVATSGLAPVTGRYAIRPGVATGVGRGVGVSVAGRAPGTGASASHPAIATGVGRGVGVSVAGSARGTGASASRPGVATGFSHGVGVGVAGRAASPAPSSIAPASAPSSPVAVPAPGALPAKQEKSKPQSRQKVEKGALIEAPNPVYPAEASEQKIEGTVRVAIVIDENGKVVSARAKSGPGPQYAASQEAAYKARFKPTVIDGKPAEVAAAISYNFVIAGE